jgi:uncharacterized protein YfbU (UPF0304 family)
MVGKQERVELRLDEDLLGRVDRWAAEHAEDAPSRSEALRRLLHLGLQVAGGQALHFTPGDKLLFTLLSDIADKLGVEGQADRELMSEVFRGGHYWAPLWMRQGLFHHDADRPEDVEFVVEVLQMWSDLEAGFDALAPSERETVMASQAGRALHFDGFDGNHESDLHGIASFLVERMGRFSRFKGRAGLNANGRRVERYRRMLRVYRPLRARLVGVPLDARQLIEIVQAPSRAQAEHS